MASQLPTPPFLKRLESLASLSPATRDILVRAAQRSRQIGHRREFMSEGKPISEPLIIVAGWAARVRILPDGRRQFLSFLLPGDLIGMCRQDQPLAVSTVIAITDVEVCPAPFDTGLPDLKRAYGMSHALDEAYLLAQITRLGRLSAQERICDLLLEFHERLSLAGLVVAGSFDIPLTQEILADSLGLTAVHINRTLQQARREDDLIWRSGRVTLCDPAGLQEKVGRMSPRVSVNMPIFPI